MTRYLTLPDVLALHAEVMERLGFRPAPLRGGGEGVLDSAIHRPINPAVDDGADLVRQAALLGIGIAQAQAFLDGNKRTAYYCADVFLRANGWRFSGEPLAFADELVQLADHHGDFEAANTELEQWLLARVGQMRDA